MLAKTRSAQAGVGEGVGVAERVADGVGLSVPDTDGRGGPAPADPQAEQEATISKRTAASRERGILDVTESLPIRLLAPWQPVPKQTGGGRTIDEMAVDDEVAELLAGPLSEFTSRRNAKASKLKQAGQRELAAEVAGLKKPPVAVWAVDQLARRNAPLLERLRRAGEDVVQAQSSAVAGRKNAAQELRSVSDALQRELEGAARATTEVLQAEGHAADEATLRRVQEMLRLAAVSGGETWDRLQRGALIREPQAGEDMLTAAFAVGGGGVAAGTRAKDGDQKKRAAAREAADTEKRIELEHALRTAKLGEQAAHQAEQTAQRLRDEADRMAADAKRSSQKARQAENDVKRALAKAKASREAARRLSARPKPR